MKEGRISAGIDIGTTTTQVIFSRLTMQETSRFGELPRTEITHREILYRSAPVLTPLTVEGDIDGTETAALVMAEYRRAGLTPADIDSGALIITGETLKKRNAKAVAAALSELAGEFVVAAAGADLEGVLAAKGAGSLAWSEDHKGIYGNLDIGGGTTNYCFMEHGKVLSTPCLDIGGRMIQIKEARITAMTWKAETYARQKQLKLVPGVCVEAGTKGEADLLVFVRLLAELLLDRGEVEEDRAFFATEGSEPRWVDCQGYSFSGGVSDCMYHDFSDYAFGDIGVLLGRAMKEQTQALAIPCRMSKETIHATVIGAGNESLELSGSTIEYRGMQFPMKNIPVLRVDLGVEQLSAELGSAIRRGLLTGNGFALAADGIGTPSFSRLEAVAEAVAGNWNAMIDEKIPLILILEADLGKALGQALKRRLPESSGFLCMDRLRCREGDFIDVGEPVGGNRAIPVVIKTLIFPEHKEERHGV